MASASELSISRPLPEVESPFRSTWRLKCAAGRQYLTLLQVDKTCTRSTSFIAAHRKDNISITSAQPTSIVILRTVRSHLAYLSRRLECPSLQPRTSISSRPLLLPGSSSRLMFGRGPAFTSKHVRMLAYATGSPST
jgi:hypothetical protein